MIDETSFFVNTLSYNNTDVTCEKAFIFSLIIFSEVYNMTEDISVPINNSILLNATNCYYVINSDEIKS